MNASGLGSLSVAQALRDAHALGVDRLDTLMLLADTLACSRTWLLAHDDAELSAEQAIHLRARLARRASGEPLAYLLGETEFHGLMLKVDSNVLVALQAARAAEQLAALESAPQADDIRRPPPRATVFGVKA